MDFTYTEEQEAFRAELRGWLTANLTDDLRIEDPTDERVAPDRETFERRREWQKRMYAAGWVGISWPKAYGGRGQRRVSRWSPSAAPRGRPAGRCSMPGRTAWR